MTKFVAILVSVGLSIVVFGQKSEPAIGKYAENGKLISVANLAALKECAIRSASGKVTSVKIEGNRADVRLRHKKEESVNVEIPLERLLDDDRRAFISDLLRKKMPLRVSGYACGTAEAIEAFSVDRVY